MINIHFYEIDTVEAESFRIVRFFLIEIVGNVTEKKNESLH